MKIEIIAISAVRQLSISSLNIGYQRWQSGHCALTLDGVEVPGVEPMLLVAYRDDRDHFHDPQWVLLWDTGGLCYLEFVHRMPHRDITIFQYLPHSYKGTHYTAALREKIAEFLDAPA